MDLYLTVKTLHILSSTILLGTGIGIAFFMFRSYFATNSHQKLYAAKTTVLADYLFTLPAVVIQPISGIWLVINGGYNWVDLWLISTVIIYAFVGLCWIPVVWIQIQLKQILIKSLEMNTPLPLQYNHLFKIWMMLGIPAFIGLVAIFFLMVMKPL